MFLVKIVPPLLAAAALILTAVLDYLHRDKRTTRFKRGRRWLFATLGLFLLATPISVYLDDRARDEAAERLNRRLADLMTGGEAHAIARVSALTKINGPVVGYNLYIEHPQTEALLYDLRINIFEIHESQSTFRQEEFVSGIERAHSQRRKCVQVPDRRQLDAAALSLIGAPPRVPVLVDGALRAGTASGASRRMVVTDTRVGPRQERRSLLDPVPRRIYRTAGRRRRSVRGLVSSLVENETQSR